MIETNVVARTTGAIAELRFSRPRKKNAITMAMYDAMADGLAAAEADPAVRVVVIGADGDTFTAGNDLADFMANPPRGDEAPVFRFLRAISTARKPLVAVVGGAAVGVGTTLLLHCDFVVASTRATFAMPFVNLGLVPEAASSLLLPRVTGMRVATELLMLGEPIDAATALRCGIVSRVVEPDALEGEAAALAAKLAAKAPEALRLTKQLLRGDGADVAARMREEGGHFGDRLQSPEVREAIAAFFAKRAPDFSRV